MSLLRSWLSLFNPVDQTNLDTFLQKRNLKTSRVDLPEPRVACCGLHQFPKSPHWQLQGFDSIQEAMYRIEFPSSSCASSPRLAIDPCRKLSELPSSAKQEAAVMHVFRSHRLVRPVPIAVAIIVVSCMFSGQTNAQRNLSFEPYSVFVAQADTFARCGPSEDYYRTDALRHGQSLDVYAETDDGWLGIRPPEDSFCWVPADTVEIDEGQETGLVSEDRTVAWIGTHLGRARKYRWQVQLAQGEPVTVIGKSERDGPDGPQLWYRIVPPSGEYRWIHRNQIVQTSEQLIATVDSSSPASNNAAAATEPLRSIAQASVQPASAQQIPNKQAFATSEQSIVSRSQSVNASANQNQSIGSGLNTITQAPILNPAPGSISDTPPAADPWQHNRTRASSREQASANQPTTVTEAMKQGGLLASVEFIGRPKLLEIGDRPAAPAASEKPADSNWIAGAVRPAQPTTTISQPGPTHVNASQFATGQFNQAPTALANLGTPPGVIMQTSAIEQIAQPQLGQSQLGQPQLGQSQSTSTQPLNVLPASRITKVISAERIAQIETETLGADVDKLSLIFSRLMAAQASSVEVEPIARAARTLASSSVDALVGGRARLLAERAEQYIRVATRRDGNSVIQTTGTQSAIAPAIPGGIFGTSQVSPASSQTLLGNAVPPADPSAMEGYLVQVYSARTNSPPFALTDNSGRTLAYVTPIPGVNLRPHLNSKVSVSGKPGFLTGLNTPHIMASQAVRTPE